MLLIVPLITIVVIAGAVVWLAASDDGVTHRDGGWRDEPGVAFVAARLNDDAITMDGLEAWGAREPARTVSPLLSGVQITLAAEGDRIVENDISLSEGRYSVWANTAPDGDNRPHPVAIFVVQ